MLKTDCDPIVHRIPCEACAVCGWTPATAPYRDTGTVYPYRVMDQHVGYTRTALVQRKAILYTGGRQSDYPLALPPSPPVLPIGRAPLTQSHRGKPGRIQALAAEEAAGRRPGKAGPLAKVPVLPAAVGLHARRPVLVGPIAQSTKAKAGVVDGSSPMSSPGTVASAWCTRHSGHSHRRWHSLLSGRVGTHFSIWSATLR